MAKRPVRAATAKVAYTEPEFSEPDSLSEEVSVLECPCPIIPLHLRPSSDSTKKRTRFADPEVEDRNDESVQAQSPRKKRAGSVVNLAAVSDKGPPSVCSAGGKDEAPAGPSAEERKQHPQPSTNVSQLGDPPGLTSRNPSPSLDQRGQIQPDSPAAAELGHLVSNDVGHLHQGLYNPCNPRTNAVHVRAPRRTAWTVLQDGLLRAFNFSPRHFHANSSSNLTPVVTLDDLSTAAINNCVQILVADQDRLKAEHSTTLETLARLGHGAFHPEATLQWQVAVRLAAIERIVRRADLDHAIVESKRAAAIWDMYSTTLSSSNAAHETNDGANQVDEQQIPSVRNEGIAVSHRLTRQIEAAKQDHDTMAARVQDAGRHFVTADEALAAAKRSLEEFTNKTKDRLECLEAQDVYVGRCLDAVQVFTF